MSIKSYKIQIISDAIFIDLPALFFASFKKHRPMYKFKEKFNFPNSQFGYVSYIARDNNHNTVAFYAVYPIKVVINNAHIWTCQSGDTMTHPEHGGNGLFVNCASSTYILAYKKGINSVFGFPSSSSYKGFLKLGWKFPNIIRRKRLMVPTLPVFILYKFNGFIEILHKKYCRFVISLLPLGSIFSGILSRSSVDHVLHDSFFWAYKLNNPDNYLIKIFGVNYVFKIDEGKITLGDFDYDNISWPFASQIMFRFISLLLLIPIIDYYASHNNPNLNRLISIGGTSNALPFGYMRFDESTDLSNLIFTSLDFDTF